MFLLTSRWELLPISIVEAFQAGLPTVVTACAGTVELVDDTVGAVVPVGDLEAIGAALHRVLDDEGQRRKLAAASAARSREPRFDPDVVHARLLGLYDDLRSDRPPRPVA